MTSPWCPTPPPSPEPPRTPNRSSPPPPRSCGVSPTAAGSTSSTTRSSADGPQLVHVPRRRGDAVIRLEGEVRLCHRRFGIHHDSGNHPKETSDDRHCPFPRRSRRSGGELR